MSLFLVLKQLLITLSYLLLLLIYRSTTSLYTQMQIFWPQNPIFNRKISAISETLYKNDTGSSSNTIEFKNKYQQTTRKKWKQKNAKNLIFVLLNRKIKISEPQRRIAGITIIPQNLSFLRLSHRKTPQKHYSGLSIPGFSNWDLYKIIV